MKKILLLILGVMYAPGTESVDGRTSMSAGSTETVMQTDWSLHAQDDVEKIDSYVTHQLRNIKDRYEVLEQDSQKIKQQAGALEGKVVLVQNREQVVDNLLVNIQKQQNAADIRDREMREHLADLTKRTDGVERREQSAKEWLESLQEEMRKVNLQLADLTVERAGVKVDEEAALRKYREIQGKERVAQERARIAQEQVRITQEALTHLNQTLQNIRQSNADENVQPGSLSEEQASVLGEN